MHGPRKPFRCHALALWLLFGFGWSQMAHAAPALIRVRYGGPELEDAARRVASELATEGYSVRVEAGSAPTDCRSPASWSLEAPAAAWIQLDLAGPESSTIQASICHASALSTPERATTEAPLSNPQQLALATAEALNGLRIQPPQPRQFDPPNPKPLPAGHVLPTAAPYRGENRIFAGPALLLDASALPPSLTGYVAVDLGVASALGLAVDTFWSIQAAELQSEQVTASVRLAAVRLGPRVEFRIGNIEVACAALAGPTLVWATASARAPRIGTADMTAAAIFSVRASLAYPKETSVFGYTAAGASTLLPRIRVDLGSEVSDASGAFLLEAAVGLGARWGDVD